VKNVVEKKQLAIGNRDGELYKIKDEDGKCWLVLEANTYHCEETFAGLGSTTEVEISLPL
jgi:hypothetical protein